MDFAKSLIAHEILALSVLAIVVSAVVSYILARKISISLNSLRRCARDFAAGDFEVSIEDSPIYEISQLGKSMGSMARQLKKRISSLHKRNCELDEIFSHMSECVLICTDEGLLLKANDAAKKTLGITMHENSRPKLEDVIRNRALLSAIHKTFSGSKPIFCDIEINGGRRAVMKLESVFLPYESRTRRALFVLHDISIERNAESLRREFVAGVSHELKTPVTGIMGAAEILAEGADEIETQKLVQIISENSKRMNTLVEDMLLLSKIETAEYMPMLKFSDSRICDILAGARAPHEADAAKRGQSMTTYCCESLHAKLDATLLTLAVSNLIGNAVKYSGAASIISIAAKKLDDTIEICVSDNGPGIEAEHMDRVFERFYRVEKGRWRNVGGSGIGLAIVKHVAAIHGGRAVVESQSGQGSKFTITIKT